MNGRTRWIEALTYGSPDKVPFSPGGPRESTLRAWREQGLPEGPHWFEVLADKIGLKRESASPRVSLGVDFRMIPQFEEKVLEHRDGHYVVQDWKGNICEIADTFDVTYLRTAKDFVTRRWVKCPVETRDDWEAMKPRYDVDAPGRFPEDFEDRCARAADRDWILSVHTNGPFWQLREWCGFEPLCMMLIEDPDFVRDMISFWTEYVSKTMARALDAGSVDAIWINEDMAYKEKPMISPGMTREFLAPAWECWTREAREAGVPILDEDSDGMIDLLIPIWIESGFNVCDPVEVAAGNDLDAYRRTFGKKIAFRQGVDKRCIAKGGKIIEEELARLEPVIRDGGYIPGCDHGVPFDISWPDFVHYGRLLAELTGWL